MANKAHLPLSLSFSNALFIPSSERQARKFTQHNGRGEFDAKCQHCLMKSNSLSTAAVASSVGVLYISKNTQLQLAEGS